MDEPLKLMCVFAHPDDETLGPGALLAKYADEGIQTYLITATRGERGWRGDPEDYPGEQAFGEMRQEELHAAARLLRVREGVFLDYIDGDVDQADPTEAAQKIAHHIRRIRPQVILTFDPFGVYGHPDHIAISQFTQAAIVLAASPENRSEDGLEPFQVKKLYYMAETDEILAQYEAAFGELIMHVDGKERHPVGFPSWALTTVVDTARYSQKVWEAVQCYRSQFPDYETLAHVFQSEDNPWKESNYYRVFSLVNGGRKLEHDLFEGIR